MSFEPGGKPLGLTFGQQIDHLVSLQVDEDGAVAAPFLPGEVIDPDDSPRAGGSRTALPHQPYQRIMADAQADAHSNALPHFAAQYTGRLTQSLFLPQRATSIGGSSDRQPLGKEFALAGGIETAEAAHLHKPLHTLPTTG